MSEEIGDRAEWYRVSVQRENHQIAEQLKERFPSFSMSSGKCLSSQDQKNGWFKRLLSGNYSNFSPADYVMVSLNVSFHSPQRPQVHALILAKKESEIRAVWSFRRNVGPQLAYVQLSMADSCGALNSLEKYLTKRESTELNRQIPNTTTTQRPSVQIITATANSDHALFMNH